MKVLKKMIYGILLFLGIGLILFYFFQERFLFLPGKRLSQNFTFDFPHKFEEINIETSDGETLNALHFKLAKPKGIVLFFHGNKGNLARWGKIVPYLLDYQYEVFVIDYRNYGKSTGHFHESLMYKDAMRAYEHVNSLYPEGQIVVYGRSLGSTFAARVGTKFNPKHIILEAPFYNMKKATQFYFFLSPSFLLKYHFRTDLDVPKIQSPMTFFHGDGDKTTSFEDSKELFKLVNSEQRTFVEIPNGTHHNLKDFKVYQQQMKRILN